MTTSVVLRCDNCGASSLVLNQGITTGWWQMQPYAGLGQVATTKPQDLCPACVSKLRGWWNPVVAGTDRRARETA